VHQHLVPAGDGDFLQLDAVVVPIQPTDGAPLRSLLICLKPTSPSRPTASVGWQQQQQQQMGWAQGTWPQMRVSKSLDVRNVPQRGFKFMEGRAVLPSQQSLYLTLASLPMAVTLLNPSGQVVWQNGRQVLTMSASNASPCAGLEKGQCHCPM